MSFLCVVAHSVFVFISRGISQFLLFYPGGFVKTKEQNHETFVIVFFS